MFMSLCGSAMSESVITKLNEGNADIAFTLSVERQPNATSVLCRIAFTKTGKLESFQRADLYLGDKPHEYMDSDADQHPAIAGRDRHASLLIQLPVVTLDEESQQHVASFLLPANLAESAVIRLHCKKEMRSYNSVSINTYVIHLGSYIPKEKPESRRGESEESIDIKIGP
jgi:hypothetical protein